MIDKGYQSVFENLPEEKQSELIRRKADFAIMPGFSDLRDEVPINA